MPWRLGQPRVLGLGDGQLMRLLAIIHPCPTSAILAALLQAGVPHRSANSSDLFRILGLLCGELHAKPAPRQHV
jgi:hypothetical protein